MVHDTENLHSSTEFRSAPVQVAANSCLERADVPHPQIYYMAPHSLSCASWRTF